MEGNKDNNPRIRVKMESAEFSDLLSDNNQSTDFRQEHHHKESIISLF